MSGSEKTSNTAGTILHILLLVLGVLLAIGTQTLFKACGPMEDGSYMTCHWAQQAVSGVGFVLAVQAVLGLIAQGNAARRAYAIAMIPGAVLAAVIPNHVIHLCMMPEMHCRAVMAPAVLVISVLIVAVALITAVLYGREAK